MPQARRQRPTPAWGSLQPQRSRNTKKNLGTPNPPPPSNPSHEVNTRHLGPPAFLGFHRSTGVFGVGMPRPRWELFQGSLHEGSSHMITAPRVSRRIARRVTDGDQRDGGIQAGRPVVTVLECCSEGEVDEGGQGPSKGVRSAKGGEGPSDGEDARKKVGFERERESEVGDDGRRKQESFRGCAGLLVPTAFPECLVQNTFGSETGSHGRIGEFTPRAQHVQWESPKLQCLSQNANNIRGSGQKSRRRWEFGERSLVQRFIGSRKARGAELYRSNRSQMYCTDPDSNKDKPLAWKYDFPK
ncbi:hypothetical protein FB451DRAFT_1176036 [Mycena latifolia]|nr:hypothetical protein FB451DRAFT_1176036 [Mycena latifolia]